MKDTQDSTSTPTLAFKGFDQNMQCRGFQYADGQTYEHDGPVRLCASGFHAVLAPLDVLAYYPPNTSEYRVVELADVDPQREGDSKVVARKLTVGAKIGIPGLVAAQIKYVTERAITEKGGHATGYSGAASATGISGAASATGYSGAAAATGYSGAASATGYSGAAAATGYRGAAAATGIRGAAAATGDRGAAAATGINGAAAATGINGAAAVKGKESVAIATGYAGKAAGALGCWIVVTERDDDYHILEVRAVCVDGETIKAGVYYKLIGGNLVEAGEVK